MLGGWIIFNVKFECNVFAYLDGELVGMDVGDFIGWAGLCIGNDEEDEGWDEARTITGGGVVTECA